MASASPRRKELLERAGVDFEVLPASGDENRISDNPGEAVKQLASDKAASVIRTMKDSADGTIVIGSDTVVVFENVILGKPHDTEDAVNTLKKLQADTHQVYTGVSVWEKKEKVWTEHTFYESTDVTFIRFQMRKSESMLLQESLWIRPEAMASRDFSEFM